MEETEQRTWPEKMKGIGATMAAPRRQLGAPRRWPDSVFIHFSGDDEFSYIDRRFVVRNVIFVPEQSKMGTVH
jgi:hypothetical protein